MPHDVLMIDDEEALAVSTTEYLTLSGVPSTYVTSAEDALRWLAHDSASIILLDVNLPGMSGFELCRRLRGSHEMPIVFISARGADDDQVLALSVGGDDYIVKPYSLSVLLAKIRRVLARTRASVPATPETYDDGRLRVDPVAQRAFVDGAEVPLTALEYRLLAHLVAHRGRVVAKQELFTEVWGDPITGDSTLSVHIRRLRRRIEPDPNQPTYIRTVWGRGYLFEAP